MFSIQFEKYILGNGLEVILHQDNSLPNIAVNVWSHVGSKDEDLGLTGFAHLFEHMMFEGSKNHDKDYFEPLQKVGGSINGSTTSDRTNYWETVPSNYLELALWLEADRMGFLLDTLDQKRFDIQRDVVKNERRQSYENRPYGSAELLLQKALFPPPHPYNWPVIGSQDDLAAALLEDAKKFFRRYYSPSNASISIAGDFEVTKTKSLINLYFGSLPPGPSIDRVGRIDSPLSGETRITTYDNVQLPRLYLVWPGARMFDAQEAPLEILATMLGDGKSSRLYRSLVHNKQVARHVTVESYAQEIAGEFHIQITANPGHSLEKIQDALEEELAKICKEPPSDHEIERAQNRIKRQHILQLESIGGFGGRADQLNYYNVMSGDPETINSDLGRYLSVKPEDVTRAASSTLSTSRVWMAVLPERNKSASNNHLDRSLMPKRSTTKSFTPPVPSREQLDNGINVLFVEKPNMPLVSFALILPTGASADDPNQPGIAHMTASILSEGTATRSSQQISDDMEFLGAHLTSVANREYTVLSTEILNTHWDSAIDIMADVIKNPAFPLHELERLRRERLIDIRRTKDNPSSIAGQISRALVYGPDTKYGHPVIGTEESIKSLTINQLKSHFKSHYHPEGATLIVVGNVSKDVVTSKIFSCLGDWKQSTETSPDGTSSNRYVPHMKTTVFIFDKPGAPQSVIRAAHLTVPHNHPNYFPLTIANYIFGGQPTSRLFMNLRQDKGYSYGYYSTIDWLTGTSALFAGGSVETSVTKEAVVETIKEFADIRGKKPVTETEFKSAKNSILRSFPSQFEQHSQIVNQLGTLSLFGLPDDYFTKYIHNVKATTLKEVRRAADENIDDKHLCILVVGDRKIIEPRLEELDLPIIPVDHEGRTIP